MFRFDWRSFLNSPTRNSVIWSDGDEAYSWTPSASLGTNRFVFAREIDFNSLIELRTRQTGGMVFTVPSLLVPDVAPYTFGDVIRNLSDPVFVRQETIDGERCYLIRGNANGVPWSLWVGTRSLLLRKARSLGSLGSFGGRTAGATTDPVILEERRHQIRINGPIDATVFQFRPVLQTGDINATD